MIGLGFGFDFGIGPAAVGDPDANLYADAVVAAGGTVTPSQRAALSTFVFAEKAASRWTTIKRLYLPIWNDAEANAIDLKTLVSGTFAGTVTRSAGYITGDGATGRFLSDMSPSAAGMTQATGLLGFLRTANVPGNQVPIGSTGLAGVDMITITDFGGIHYYDHTDFAGGRLGNAALGEATGIVTARAFSGSLTNRVRKTAGITHSGTKVNGAAGGVTTNAVAMMCRNYNGSFDVFSAGSYGAFFFGLGMSDADDEAFTLNLKTLWESLTGLALP